MARIVLAPLGSLGDLHPFLSLALGLAGRGHEVVFAAADFYRSRIEGLGFQLHPMRPAITPDHAEKMAYWMDARKGPERVLREFVLPVLPESYADLSRALAGADFLVSGELVFAARTAAEVHGLPWAFVALSPLSFFSAYDPSVLPPFPALARLRSLGPAVNGAIVRFGHRVTRPWGEPIQRLRRELGLPPVENPFFDGKHSPHLVLALYSRLLGGPQPDWPASAVQTGFAFYDRDETGADLPEELDRFLSEGEAPVVFTLGSAAVGAAGDFFARSAAAAELLGRRAVLLVGDNPNPPGLSPWIVSARYAPYSQLFPRAAAIVHQGGIGTCGQALRAGRPALVVPWGHDQPDNAARLVRLGTSRTLPRERYTAGRAARELARLLDDPAYTAKAAAAAAVIRQEDGVGAACDAIEARLLPAATPNATNSAVDSAGGDS